MGLLGLKGLDPGNLLSNALVDALLEGGVVPELEEDLEVHKEGCEYNGCAKQPSTHAWRYCGI